MAEPLKYKVERSIAAYLGTLAGLSAFTITEGQKAASVSPPLITVYCDGMRDSFADSLPKDCRVVVEVVSAIDTDADADNVHGEATDRATNYSTHLTACQVVEAAFQEAAAATFIAFCAVGNITNRPVTAFYVYDIQEDGQGSTVSGEDRLFISTFSYTVICEAQDNS